MINFDFSIKLPIDRWENIWSASYKTLFPHKYLDFDFYRSSDLIHFSFSWEARKDHAGFEIDFGLFCYSAFLMFYDNRHWNSLENCWENYK